MDDMRDYGEGSSHTLVVNFGPVLSAEALVLQRLVVHVELLHHVVVELVPPAAGAAAVQRERKKKQRMNERRLEEVSSKQL